MLYIYKHLYTGEVIWFDLSNQGTTHICTNNKDHTVSHADKSTLGITIVRNGHDNTFDD